MINTEQHEVIGWRDPSETVDSTPKRGVKAKGIPCFSISCLNEDLKNTLIKRIISLNGKVCENLLKYDNKCTHFICEKPSRSEKMMSCVAAGKWVLGINYIIKSYEANRFLDVRKIPYFQNPIPFYWCTCQIFYINSTLYYNIRNISGRRI